MRWTVARCLSVLCSGALLGGCDSSTANKEPTIKLSASTTSATLAQGASTTIVLTIERTNFAKTVTLIVDGAPPGVTAQVSPGTATESTPTATLVVTATLAATPGSGSVTVRGTGEGITEQSVTIALTVTPTGAFTLGVFSPSVTVAQGGGDDATILVPRSGGNGASVSLAATGLPAGLTGTFTPAATTSSGATLSLVATGSVPVGTYTVTITGSSTGFPDQPTTLLVNVIAPPATATISVPFCATGVPAWFAYKNEGSAWQRVTPSGTTFTFAATSRFVVAFVFGAGSPETQLNVFYVTRAEFSASNDRDCSGSKNFTGTVAGLSAGQSAQVVMGAASATASSTTPSYSLQNVATRPLDLVATRGIVSGQNGEFLAPDRMIVRRALDLATGAVIPALDFAAAESFAPTGTNLSIGALEAPDHVEMQNTLWTTTSTFGTAHAAVLSGGTTTLFSAPAAQLVAGDLHELYVDARQSTSTLVIGRSYVEYFMAPSDKSFALGGQLNTPTITMVTNSPYPRMRGQLAVQSEYNTSVQVAWIQDFSNAPSRVVVLAISSAYLGATPGTWDSLIPDLTGIAGFSTSWALVPNVTTVYSVEAFSGRTDLLFGALPAQGDVVRLAYRAGLTSTAPFFVSRGARKAGRRLPQYLRR